MKGRPSVDDTHTHMWTGHCASGAGGWPTVRYFNKETGYGGKAYPKKTSKAMCDELGPKENLGVVKVR